MNYNIGDKIIRYHIISGVVESLELFEVESFTSDNKCIKLNDHVTLYKNNLKERHTINNLHLSRRACQKINKQKVYYRYKVYSEELWNDLKGRMNDE